MDLGILLGVILAPEVVQNRSQDGAKCDPGALSYEMQPPRYRPPPLRDPPPPLSGRFLMIFNASDTAGHVKVKISIRKPNCD